MSKSRYVYLYRSIYDDQSIYLYSWSLLMFDRPYFESMACFSKESYKHPFAVPIFKDNTNFLKNDHFIIRNLATSGCLYVVFPPRRGSVHHLCVGSCEIRWWRAIWQKLLLSSVISLDCNYALPVHATVLPLRAKTCTTDSSSVAAFPLFSEHNLLPNTAGRRMIFKEIRFTK